MARVLKNAQLVLNDEIIVGCLQFENGIITSIDAGASDVGEDCENDFIFPGIVELHTDNLERHVVPRPAAPWPNILSSVITHDAEIACAGITTVFDSLRMGAIQGEQLPHATLLPKMLEGLSNAVSSGVLRSEHFLHLRLEMTDPQLMELIEKYTHQDELKLISLMDHTPGQRQWANIDALRMHNSKSTRTAEEIETMIQQRIDAGSEHVSTNRDRILSHFSNRAITLASHDDTTLEHIEEAVRYKVSISEFPCSLEAARAAKAAGLYILGGAPNIVRGGSHSGNVNMMELVDEGLLDGMSSDYVPSSLLQAVFMLAEKTDWSLPAAARLVTSNTAAMVGLSDRGELAIGKRADFSRIVAVDGAPAVKATYVAGQRVA